MTHRYAVHLGGTRYRYFKTLDAASAFCSTVFERSGVVLSIVKERRWTLAEIRHENITAGFYFFSRDTMRWFGDTMKSWSVVHMDGRVYVRRVRQKRDGNLNLGGIGELREFNPETGHIGAPIKWPAQLSDNYQISETVDGTWIVLRHGFQIGARPAGATCGTAEYATRDEALAAALEDQAQQPS